MSSKPHPEGVREVIGILTDLEDAQRELKRLEPERDRLVKQVDELRTRAADLGATLGKKLSGMDVDSPGNWGWEGRFGWFLGEFRRQLLAAKNPEKPDAP